MSSTGSSNQGLSAIMPEPEGDEGYFFYAGMVVRWASSIPNSVLAYYQSLWENYSFGGSFEIVQVEEAEVDQIHLLHHSQIVTVYGPDQKEYRFSGEWFQPV